MGQSPSVIVVVYGVAGEEGGDFRIDFEELDFSDFVG
jgi:hypothetical protein